MIDMSPSTEPTIMRAASDPPVARTIEATCARYSWTRSYVFLKLASGELEAVKAGRRTNVTTESADRLQNSLPKATYRAPRQIQAA